MSFRGTAGGECNNDGPHSTARMLRNRLQPRGAYDVINTTDIYSLLWRLPRLADYVVAVAPTSILHHIKPAQCWTACAYIINVVPREVCYNTIPKRRSSPQGGTYGHWIVLIIGGEKNELFDPLGPGIVDGSECDYGHEMTDFVYFGRIPSFIQVLLNSSDHSVSISFLEVVSYFL